MFSFSAVHQVASHLNLTLHLPSVDFPRFASGYPIFKISLSPHDSVMWTHGNIWFFFSFGICQICQALFLLVCVCVCVLGCHYLQTLHTKVTVSLQRMLCRVIFLTCLVVSIIIPRCLMNVFLCQLVNKCWDWEADISAAVVVEH